MKRWAILLYGVATYAMFLGVFLYAILFIGNFSIARSLDGQPLTGFWPAVVINLALLTFFAVQHSGMARSGFKTWITKYIPEPAERSTYVLLSNVAMILMFVFWEPMGGTIWAIESPVVAAAINGAFFLGWLIVLVSTFLICHFDLFGLRQVWLQFQGKPYVQYKFQVPSAYKVIRHPLYVGWLIVFWAAPDMTIAHLLFALMTTAYILIAIQLEERDLVQAFGKKYTDYRDKVPMLIPSLGRKKSSIAPTVNVSSNESTI